MLSRDEFNEMSAERFIVFSLLHVNNLLNLLDFFLVVAHNAPLNGLFLALKLADHLLGGLHLLSFLLQIHVYLLVLFINPCHERSFDQGFRLNQRNLNHVLFVLLFERGCWSGIILK